MHAACLSINGKHIKTTVADFEALIFRRSLVVMLPLSCWLLLFVAVGVISEPPRAPFNPTCLVGTPDLYNPLNAEKVRTYIVNLNSDAKDRFRHIAAAHADQIREGVDVIRRMIGGLFGELAFQTLEYLMKVAHDTRLAQPYKDEIAVGMNTHMLLFNERYLYVGNV